MARYEISYEDIQKVMDCSILNKKLEELNVIVQMLSWKPKTHENVFDWVYELMNGEIQSMLDDDSDTKRKIIESKVMEIGDELKVVLADFQKEFNMRVLFKYDAELYRAYFEPSFDQVVQLTPQAFELQTKGIYFALVDEY